MAENFDAVENINEEFGPDIVSVVDDDGVEHTFEELDRIETDEGKFVALLPVYDEAEEILDSNGELIILKVTEEDGELYLEPIEDDKLFDKIGKLFEERLADIFEFEDEE
ncbi:MAG: DUF1292 domain-containing protein [Ruminococcaceae bacterium]|nr:DUF1292 domain-containing protein [Oscillospiraceae bacterium]